jgi:multidrug efflux pump subunit AcrA (membrane-fusion protein)
MEAAHSAMATQLADALAELSQARAQLAAAQRELEAAQAAYQQAKADAAFHMAGFVDECKRKAVGV